MGKFNLESGLSLSRFFILYIIIINIISFYTMWLDKRKAVKRQWRIPEKTLFILALLGGSIGAVLGMRAFRHKTKHWYFVWGMPAILVCQILLLYFLLCR